MQADLQRQHTLYIEQSHHGRPVLVDRVHSGGRGRPSVRIDPDFLRWAYSMRSIASISRFLGVGRTVVRQALLDYGIAEPQQDPFMPTASNDDNDFLLDPSFQAPVSGEGTSYRI